MSKLEDKLSASINKQQAAQGENKTAVKAAKKPAAKKPAAKKPAASKSTAKKAKQKTTGQSAGSSALHPQRVWPD